jgi:choline dehydrogenase-like flavoprotein
VALDAAGLAPTGRKLTLKARHFVVAGGAINSPALLMRSGAPTRTACWANGRSCIR